jgi:AraC family transcriptional regulator
LLSGARTAAALIWRLTGNDPLNDASRYHARVRKVLEYIDTHLDDALDVETLAGVAAFSKFHFHRQFSELLGLGVARYVQLRRLKRASYALAFRGEQHIVEIALASGYDGPEAFARAFKKSIGQSPSGFRKQPQWEPWHAAFEPLRDSRSKHMSAAHPAGEVSIVRTKDIRVAVLEHRGDPRLIGDSIRKFIAWRKEARLPPAKNATYNIIYDDPETTRPAEFRFDLCVSTGRDISANTHGIVARVIPGGRCALLRHTGSDDTLGNTVRYLYADWLPQSGEELRDFPAYLRRLKFFPDVPEHEAVTEVFLPLR